MAGLDIQSDNNYITTKPNKIYWDTGSASSLGTGTTYSPYIYNDSTTTASTYFVNTATHTLAYKEYDAFATGGEYYIHDNDGWVSVTPPVIAPGDRLRQMIRDRMGPAIHRGRKRTSLSIAMDVREERARQTLRRIIGEQAYRKFFRDGFITVVPKSGLTYRIFPGYGMTEVYDRGIMVDKLCVVLKGDFPPTDSLIMRYLLILNDEGEFSKYAIKHHVSQSRSTKLILPEVKPLTETWAKLKVA